MNRCVIVHTYLKLVTFVRDATYFATILVIDGNSKYLFIYSFEWDDIG